MGEVKYNICDRCGSLLENDAKHLAVTYAGCGCIGALLCADCCTQLRALLADFLPQKYRLPSILEQYPELREQLLRKD